MSAKQTGLVWELALPHNEAWVLMAMANHADHEGNNVYPGVPLLAWKTGYTTRQIRRILTILQEKGLIVVEQEGGGRKTTRYRLELSSAKRKDPYRPDRARSGRATSNQDSESREDKMSPLVSAASEAPMSPQPGQNVRGARTQLCHPNRQGRESIEPSIPPPSDSSPHSRPPRLGRPLPDGENGEGWKGFGGDRREDGDSNRTAESPTAALWRVWIEWAGRAALPPERRQAFDRQAKALASGEDLNAWTHPLNGALVPSGDRLRIFKLGLQHLQDMTSRTLRGGVMYAVTKCYRIPPPVPGTEYAAVVARGPASEDPGRRRAATGSTEMVAARSILQPPAEFGCTADGDPVERWEREFPEEGAKLRESIVRQIAAEVQGRRISEQTLLLVGRTQYRHLVLRRIEERNATKAGVAFYQQNFGTPEPSSGGGHHHATGGRTP